MVVEVGRIRQKIPDLLPVMPVKHVDSMKI